MSKMQLKNLLNY